MRCLGCASVLLEDEISDSWLLPSLVAEYESIDLASRSVAAMESEGLTFGSLVLVLSLPHDHSSAVDACTTSATNRNDPVTKNLIVLLIFVVVKLWIKWKKNVIKTILLKCGIITIIFSAIVYNIFIFRYWYLLQYLLFRLNNTLMTYGKKCFWFIKKYEENVVVILHVGMFKLPEPRAGRLFSIIFCYYDKKT